MGATNEQINVLADLAAVAEIIDITLTRKIDRVTGEKSKPLCDLGAKINHVSKQTTDDYKIKGPCHEVKNILLLLRG
ncbi:MAG: hypothetical protein MK188_16105 [Gammaproteobacteria bacterium]|nr:hypothetical protein [Gammaproteobacteria bacterium]